MVRVPAGRKLPLDQVGFALGATGVYGGEGALAGTLDFNAELELWTRAGHIKVKLGRDIDIRRLDQLIAHAVFGQL